MPQKDLNYCDFYINQRINESLNFDPSYTNQSMMLWFSYDTKYERQIISSNETRIRINGNVKLN